MGVLRLMREGTWWVSSRSQPEWNRSGNGRVGGGVTIDDIPEAQIWLRYCRQVYGPEPEDLTFGWMRH